MAGLMVGIAALVLVVAVGLPLVAAKNWKGGWKFGAVFPLIGLLGACGLILLEVYLEPSSHNMWPFEVVMWGVATLVLLGIIAGLRERFRD